MNNELLQLRRIAIDTYKENVAYMHRDCEFYRVEGFQALTKVEVRANGQHIFAVLNVVDDESTAAVANSVTLTTRRRTGKCQANYIYSESL